MFAAIAAGISGAMSLASGFMQASSAKKQGAAQAAVGAYNMNMSKRNAELVRLQGKLKETDLKKQHERIKGLQRVGYASAGVTMEGTPLEVLMQSAREAEEELIRLRYFTNQEAYSALAEGQMAYSQGQQAKSASQSSAFMTILGSAVNAASTGISVYTGLK